MPPPISPPRFADSPDMRRHAVAARREHRPLVRRARRQPDRGSASGADPLPRRGGEEHCRAREHRHRRLAGRGEGIGEVSRGGHRRRGQPRVPHRGSGRGRLLRPDRIVIGGDPGTVEVLRPLYEPFEGVPIIATSTRNAEMIKYASNALLATAISFANEIADVGSAIGEIDIAEVMAGVHASRHLTTTLPTAFGSVPGWPLPEAGCGYGGSCLPKDVAAPTSRGRSAGLTMLYSPQSPRSTSNEPIGWLTWSPRVLTGWGGRSRCSVSPSNRTPTTSGSPPAPCRATPARCRSRGDRPRPRRRSGRPR